MIKYNLDLKLLQEIKDAVFTFAKKYEHDKNFFVNNLRSNRNDRRYCVVNRNDQIDEDFVNMLKKERERLFNSIGVSNFEEEPCLGIFVAVNDVGGAVQKHVDSCDEGFDHVRINCIVSLPERGGLPVIEGNQINLNEGDIWLLVASRWCHWSTPVEGNKKRIIVSFGALIDSQTTNKIISNLGEI